MLADYAPVATLAVKDLHSAREFYEGVLGFAPTTEAPDGVFYAAGSGSFFVYPSGHAGTNRATSMSFQVPEGSFDAEVDALRGKGVTFQIFEMDGVSWDNGVATFGEGGYRGVWFEDPDGNILNLDSVAGN